MSDGDPTPSSVVALYQQLAAERAGMAQAAIAQQRTVDGLFSTSTLALEQAAGALLHAAYTFITLPGPLPALFAEQAGALLAVAARFEEAADLSRTRQDNDNRREER